MNEGHELTEFMRDATQQMASDYEKIQRRAREDSGTAGDQGEENWKELFERWLPPQFQIVTKGRILNSKGVASGQVDVIVLKPSYPKALLGHKLYLADGVAAAFECKVTLKAEHVVSAIQRSAEVKRLFLPRSGTPYRELHAPMAFGLLAHSHCWKSDSSQPLEMIQRALYGSDQVCITHPREMLDLLCVADLATWTATKVPWIIPLPNVPAMKEMYGPEGCCLTSYLRHAIQSNKPFFTPVGCLITHLLRSLAWEEPTIRSLAQYFTAAELGGSGEGSNRNWSISIYESYVASHVQLNLKQGPENAWSEWLQVFC